MKIKVKELSYEEVLALPVKKHIHPKRPSLLFRLLLNIGSTPDLSATHFTCNKIGMERLGKREPCLVLMNHSSFIDLKIASKVLFPRPFNIVCTSDGFVGKGWLMRNLGCIPTKKFVSDSTLIRDMMFAVKKLKSSVLMFPEAGYSFDGTATTLPQSIGKCLKMLDVPVIMIRTYGAFARDPLYNNLMLRRVNVSAEIEYLLSREEIAEKSSAELNEIITEKFNFDSFRWQQENKIKITEEFRANGLNRVLYKCPHCQTEGRMKGKGIKLICEQCGKEYELTEYGFMKAESGETEFSHVPDWYRWERDCVRQELTAGTYHLEVPVQIYMLVDMDCLYKVGNGTLKHSTEGFDLAGCEGKLHYTQSPAASYGLNADYYWYEIGDMICIGNNDILYYCFPQSETDVVAKTRLAAEELYIIARKERKGKAHPGEKEPLSAE